MDEEQRLNPGERHDWRITHHHVWGMSVARVDEPGTTGILDVILFGDDPTTGYEAFPPVGSVIRAVVIGYDSEGELRLSTRSKDLI